MAEVPGKFGRYEILERVGRGGMGVLYRGKDPVLDREVAIKVMSGDFTADEAARSRFFREARAAARLQHRNIVTIYEFAEDEHGTPYIAMEFLRGQSLAARLPAEPPLTLVQKLDILVQLCTGLHYAHEQGIVHRDVKPANIWLMDDGTVKLLDFGIAKIAASTMTGGASVLGSAAYMAPEQVSGREIDGRADVFAAGVVLYEMLARRKPFEADGPTAVMMKIVKEDPPPIRQLAPDLPAALVNAVTKALQKDPDKRFLNAGELGAELRLIRLSLERTSETMSAEADAQQTQFMASPPVGGAAESVHGPLDALGGAPLGAHAPVSRPHAGSGSFATWVAIAAIAVAAVLAGVVLLQRRSGPEAASASETAGPGAGGTAEPAKSEPGAGGGTGSNTAPAAMVKLVTDPLGASVTIDGQDTGIVTPADVAVSDLTGNRVRVAKRGYRTVDVRAAETQLRNGVVLVKLDPAVISSTVVLAGSYPFEVVEGSRVISPAAVRHELSISSPRSLRLRASEYMLDMPITVDPAAGRRSYTVPDLGRLTVRTTLETCRVSIGGRDFGFPPINEQKLAAGSYRLRLTCPDGDDRASTVAVTAGQVRMEVIR
jgi:serine/threonine-protein kinase